MKIGDLLHRVIGAGDAQDAVGWELVVGHRTNIGGWLRAAIITRL